MSLVCARRGCGKSFNEAENYDTSCEHHSGAPVFHEGLKGWSCCSKRVTDFDEFLKIPGCSVGRHSTEAPPALPTPAKEPSIDSPKSVHNGVEHYGTTAPAATPTPEFIPKPAESKPVVKEEDLHDAPDAIIAVGTACKRKGCNKKYEDETSKTDTCIFHAGEPIFHEGSKGWTCCSRKVLEFEEFIKIQGCKTGKHRFTEVQSNESAEEFVECRKDWYQTPGSVIISLFAKKVDKKSVSVAFNEDELKVDGAFQDGKKFKYYTTLVQPIIPSESKYEVLSTKIEINLKKANGISWPSIEPTDNVVSWTTFGTTGTTGTVGGKEAYIAHDAPLHLMKK